MKKRVVSNTSSIRHLCEIGWERALGIFQTFHIPSAVRVELERQGFYQAFTAVMGKCLWIEPVTPSGSMAVRRRLGMLAPKFERRSTTDLEVIDLEVIALADRLKPAIVLTDDAPLRNVLENIWDMKVTGSVGILVRAFRNGMMDKPCFQAAIDPLFTKSTLYLSPRLKSEVLTLIDRL